MAKIIHPGDAARYCRRCHRVSERAGNCCVARKAAIGTSRTFADVRSYAASGGEATLGVFAPKLRNHNADEVIKTLQAALATNPAQGSTCCCLLPHHPHRRHHPARRQCPCNCDARTAFSGRAKKKRRGSPGGFPRRLEADVQCSRSMHRND